LRFRLTQRGVTVGAIVLTVVVVAVGVALAATSTPWFCSTCKSHVPYVDGLAASAHAGVNCEQCHTKPGPFFFLTAKLEALQQPIHQITGDYEKPILGTVLNQSCRRCHSNDILYNPVSKGGIRVQHRHLIEAGFLCIRCHSTQGHGDAVPVGSRTYPSMDQCLLCHNNEFTTDGGQVATAECDLCHTKRDYGAVPASHDDTDWLSDHGSVGILSTCSACHVEEDSCSRCHEGVEMPHDDAWMSQHGESVDETGRQACGQCHDTTEYCATCHQVAMPHPDGYVGRHPQAAERVGTATCFNCHVVSNCQACHEQHNSGDPRAHQLFEGVEYTLPATPEAAATTITTGAGD
jgi:nitrate/TMAO reductase-like tetraheme cytochrome c subunit